MPLRRFVHPVGWFYRTGSGLIDYIYTAPDGSEHTSEADALAHMQGVPQEQRPAALDGEIHRGEGAGPPARLDEGRAGTIDEINGLSCHSAASREICSSPALRWVACWPAIGEMVCAS